MKAHKASSASHGNKSINQSSDDDAKVVTPISYNNGNSSIPFILDDNLSIVDQETLDDIDRFIKSPLMYQQEQNDYSSDIDDSSTITSMQSTIRTNEQIPMMYFQW